MVSNNPTHSSLAQNTVALARGDSAAERQDRNEYRNIFGAAFARIDGFAGKELRTKSAPALLASFALAAALALCFVLVGCSAANDPNPQSATGEAAVSLDELPEYSGTLVLEINGNQPGFTEDEITRAQAEGFETYSELDKLGRCGTAYAVIDLSTMPTDERGSISEVHPSGWNQEFYDFVDQEALFNRSHLIGWQLAGENANERNLITGTRTMNSEGMLPYEDAVATYVHYAHGSVLYRVTPLFKGNELVARGVQMEALSLEDNGASVCFNVFVYNVEPGVAIDYRDGESRESSEIPAASRFVGIVAEDGTIVDAPEADLRDEEEREEFEQHREALEGNAATEANNADAGASGSESSNGSSNGGSQSGSNADTQGTYVLNTNSMKFHRPDCPSVTDTASHNREEYTGSRQELIDRGFEPCGSCNP